MNLLPKLKKCPNCEARNIIRVNGITYNNPFNKLKEWNLKKIFNCRKCKIELGFFSNAFEKKEVLIWLEMFKCEDSYYKKLNDLQITKNKLKKNNKQYYIVLDQIKGIQNKIYLDQTKIKIKQKIEKKGILIRHVY